MTLNISKFKYMTFSQSTNASMSSEYRINGIGLEHVSAYKYFCVYISDDLSWHTHIEYIIYNANRTLGYIRCNFFQAPQRPKLMLYQTFICPKLEYACAVWDPAHRTLIQSTESLQNQSASFIMSNSSRSASVSQLK